MQMHVRIRKLPWDRGTLREHCILCFLENVSIILTPILVVSNRVLLWISRTFSMMWRASDILSTLQQPEISRCANSDYRGGEELIYQDTVYLHFDCFLRSLKKYLKIFLSVARWQRAIDDWFRQNRLWDIPWQFILQSRSLKTFKQTC
jgi:hypothetical protein